ncbi:MAG: sulfurtransferase complex subunit TusB [Methylobacter sp.]|nr:sulfurtransferase complex subunit TusB [Methylobacter sp.]MDP2099427.1 sulfurtransferase complex subunit TusB [Methylobacter sp.]MDP2430099.1 sulfurtransferase complex subunit TusB [Methylobacter sp.]MDP3056054.1 sulfurtransferase complex subunit TusB [Methylobacter sp.]MDP3362194.1 sulfurtransferase complex subunit TusB [Methylobacter sp.]
MLHLIFQSPIETAILERVAVGDVLVFLENAALRVLKNSSLSAKLTQQLAANRLCVLSDDMAARGISAGELVSGIEVIDYAELVELTVQHPLIQSWS